MAVIELLPYQRRSFCDRSRFKILMWARGCRKTFTSTLEIVDSVFEAEARGQRCEWIIVSRGERQALEALKEAKRHCRAYAIAASDIAQHEVWSELAGKFIKVSEITFPRGSTVRALPALADVIRGYSSNVYLDEFDIHPDAHEVWRAAFPVLRGRYRMIISSSPKKKGGKFHEIITGTGSEWSRHVVDIYQAVAEGLPFDIELEREALADPDGWAQELSLIHI
jgi:phage FluMu gp28-like protein